ncbi:MAG TPA: platelet-activating factor acetylhydrolase IB subunit [Isosphaeraceae bacterium]|jgi:beta-glucosidase|nr:platelet-activating factor acetylhydrolase IB subunit [Isosphaeraceae bacterium]
MRFASSLRSRWLLGLAATAMLTQAPAALAQVESATEPVPRTGYWMMMHENFLDRAKEGNIDLLFLGDSITQGWGGGGKAVWERFYGPRNTANFGIGGDRTQHMLWRLDHGEVDGIHPKAVVLMIGTNNMDSNPPEEIAEGVTAIIKKLREKLPDTKILLLGVFPRDQNASARRERLGAVNERIARLDDGTMVKYLDIGKSFLSDDGTISKEIMPDFLHLSSRGYRIWADAMEPTLWSMLEGK